MCPCGRRDGAPGLRHSAADRRRHHQPRAYRRQDRSQLPPRPDGLCHRRLACGGRGLEPAQQDGKARLTSPDVRKEYEEIAREPCRAARARPAAEPCRRRAPTSRSSTGRPTRRPTPKFLGTRIFDELRSRGAGALYRLDAVLPDLGAGRANIPRSSTDDKVGKAARNLFADAQKMLKKIVDEKWLTARAAIGFWPANQSATTTSLVFGDKARKFPIATLHTLRQQMAREQRQAQSGAGRFHRARAAPTTISAASSSPPASARKRTSSASRPPRTIIPPSCCAPWPTAWRKPLPSACMRRVRREFWGYAPDEAALQRTS